MKPIDTEKLVDKFSAELKQKDQVAKFIFKKAEICFRDINAGVDFSYTTDMHAKPYAKSVPEWDKLDWRVFIRDAIKYYEENSKFSIDMVDSITLIVDCDFSIRFIL